MPLLPATPLQDRVKREAILRLGAVPEPRTHAQARARPSPSQPLPAALSPPPPLVKPLADKDAPRSPEEAPAQLQAALLARAPWRRPPRCGS